MVLISWLGSDFMKIGNDDMLELSTQAYVCEYDLMK